MSTNRMHYFIDDFPPEQEIVKEFDKGNNVKAETNA